ncbi:MAG: alpha/beta hydrolase [Desulfobacteraceae bacterium]|nr:alpha/beta hydrolase [Desulfobacteraceae bacterium]
MQNPLKYNYFKSHDSLNLRYGYTETCKDKSKGLILLLHGRAEFIEKYNEIIIHLVNKGFDVFTLDWRGQGLSDRETANRQKGYVKDFNDYLLDLKLFFDKIIKPKSQPIFMLSHSMGGHIGLRFLHDYPNIITKSVFVSPMFNIKTFLVSRLVTQAVAKITCMSGFSENFVFGGKKYDSTKSNSKNNIFSHDSIKFNRQADEIKKNPDLALGGITWGWLNAALNSINILLQKDYVTTINTPVLIINAQRDKLVKRSSQKNIYKRLPNCTYVSIKGAYHEILFEKKDFRDIFWNNFDKFIDPS